LRLTELSGVAPAALSVVDPEIAGLSADSRTVRPGYLFAALPGARVDGRVFADEAASRGAVAILTDDADALRLRAERRERLAVLVDTNPHRRLAFLSARFYGRQPRTVVAITGTNGKTSVVHFVREIWKVSGLAAASLGTLGLVTATEKRPGALTTPDPVALHFDLATLARKGIEQVAIEASSHGLHQYRLDGISVAAAGFTNLTRDHLDYHGDMAHYRAAKYRLFSTLLAPNGSAVLNADSSEFCSLASLCRDTGHPVLAYGADAAADLRILAHEPRGNSQILLLDIFGHRRSLLFPLAGAFQAMNALAALGLVIATGGSVEGATDALAHLTSVPGRLQFVAEGRDGGGIVVDYAHTPDALFTVLTTLRAQAPGRLLALFGCGGDRDTGKRPLMGQVAARLADRVYVTDDNPRNEAPAEIRRAILAAAPDAIEIADRRQAIAAAIADTRPSDLLVIAGKGHETGQIVGHETHTFDDAAIAREIAQSASSDFAWRTF
jgi:UDP-N-acetylmuramoyl-L-alanyl-D-glutamate--2,6-diaminopimelate ligase